MRRRNICKLLIDKLFRVHTARKCTESTMTPVRGPGLAITFFIPVNSLLRHRPAHHKRKMPSLSGSAATGLLPQS